MVKARVGTRAPDFKSLVVNWGQFAHGESAGGDTRATSWITLTERRRSPTAVVDRRSTLQFMSRCIDERLSKTAAR